MAVLPLLIESLTLLLTLAGIAYMLLALWGARDFVRGMRQPGSGGEGLGAGPAVSVLKPLKGVDARMYAGLTSHARQEYSGGFELVFGVHEAGDPAVAEVARLRAEFPGVAMKLVVCPRALGSSGKVSNLVQMLEQAAYEHVLINDSDILVSPGYLAGVMRHFSGEGVGMVTAPYIGCTGAGGRERTMWARMEALGIATDFMPGVLTARKLEGGIRFGLGSTLAMTQDGADAGGRDGGAGGVPGGRL